MISRHRSTPTFPPRPRAEEVAMSLANRIFRSGCPPTATPLALALVSAVLAPPAIAYPASAQAEPVRVANSRPQLPPRTIELEEIWRVGGEESEFIFGMLVASLADDEGNVYLLDNQLCQVEVFGPRGEHLRTLSRQGEGPGEVTGPIAMTLLPDGTLGLVELFPAKIEKLTLTGEPAGSVTFRSGEGAQTGFTVSVNCQCRGGVLMLAGMRATPDEAGQRRSHYVASFAETGEEKVRFRETEALLTFNPPTFVEHELLPAFWFGNAVGPDGRIYLAPSREEYTIEVYRPDGTLERIITREFENWRRDRRDRRRMEAMVEAWYAFVPADVQCTYADYEPAISEMFVDDEGILWVQNSRSGRDQPPGVMLAYDTFDPQGHYRQQVAVACDGDPAYDGVCFLGDGRALVIKGYVLARWASLSPGGNANFGEDEAGPMEVICCRVVER
jgi:hypothetical protein